MSVVAVGWPNVEEAVTALLEQALAIPDGRVGTQRPEQLLSRLPFLLVYRFGGGDDGVTDVAELGVEVFASSYAEGQPLAEAARQALLAAAATAVTVPSGRRVSVDDVVTLTAPVEAPYGGDDVRRWTATYRVSVRRPSY